MVFEVLIVAGVGVLSAGLRSFRHPVLFRLGTLGFVLTSFLAGWVFGGNVWTGMCFAATWFLLPWLEILTRVRAMRLPAERRLEPAAPPTRSAFPAFSELSDEMEAGGFEYVEDAGWSHEETRQHYRLFQSSDRKTAGAICLVEQPVFSFYYIALRSRTVDGRLLITWNYPFSLGLRQMPGTILRRAAGEKSVEELILQHRASLDSEGVGLCLVDQETLRAEIESDLRDQVTHNIACGILRREGTSSIRYTGRGLVFLWLQFLRDFVRFS